MLRTIQALIRDEGGATMVEYGLLVGFIAIVAMTGVKALGTNTSALYKTVANSI
jgi:pilus assembly protein Flp/PilA